MARLISPEAVNIPHRPPSKSNFKEINARNRRSRPNGKNQTQQISHPTPINAHLYYYRDDYYCDNYIIKFQQQQKSRGSGVVVHRSGAVHLDLTS